MAFYFSCSIVVFLNLINLVHIFIIIFQLIHSLDFIRCITYSVGFFFFHFERKFYRASKISIVRDNPVNNLEKKVTNTVNI